MSATTPRGRQDFDIAIICALRVEVDAVYKVLDKCWDDERDYGKAESDTNAYTTGAIGKHNVVVVRLPGKGSRNAAAAAGNVRHSFPNIRLALIVGICGGVPWATEHGIFLGDIVVSSAAIQYDLRRQYEGKSERINDPIANLSRQSPEVLNLVTKFDSEFHQEKLQAEIKRELRQLRAQGGKIAAYPRAACDLLFESTSVHKHTVAGQCAICDANEGQSCEAAVKAKCSELGCDKSGKIVERERPDYHDDEGSDCVPGIHIGFVGCGDTVMKSAAERDKIARQESVIAFEMEGTGVWDQCPSIILKAVCDYADSHKNKDWQKYTAIIAAVGMKALLKYWNIAARSPGAAGEPNSSPGPGRTRAPNFGSQVDYNYGTISNSFHSTPRG